MTNMLTLPLSLFLNICRTYKNYTMYLKFILNIDIGKTYVEHNCNFEQIINLHSAVWKFLRWKITLHYSIE